VTFFGEASLFLATAPATVAHCFTMKIRNVLILAALAFAPACSKDPAEQMVSMMEDMGKAAESAGADCAKMADNVEAVTKKYDLPKLKADAEKMKGDKNQSAEMMKKYGDRVQKAMPGMMAMAKCGDDPKFKAVSEKFKGMM